MYSFEEAGRFVQALLEEAFGRGFVKSRVVEFPGQISKLPDTKTVDGKLIILQSGGKIVIK